MFNGAKHWFRKIRSISTPLGGITIADTGEIRNVAQASEALVELLLACKRRNRTMAEFMASGELSAAILKVNDFLVIYHPILPQGAWLTNYQLAYNDLVQIVDQFKAKDSNLSAELVNETVANFCTAVDSAITAVSTRKFE